MKHWLVVRGKIKTAHVGIIICHLVLIISLSACTSPTFLSETFSTKADIEKPSIESTQQNNVNEEIEINFSAGEVITPENADQITLLDRRNYAGFRHSMAFSPDGHLLAIGGHSGVSLKDTASWETLHTLRNPINCICHLAFSPDGQMLASAGHEGKTIQLWDLNSGEELRTLEMPTNRVHDLAFSPDGLVLAATGYSVHSSGNTYWPIYDDIVVLWEVETWQLLNSFDPEFWGVSSLAFSPDGQILAVGGYDVIGLWDTVSWERLDTIDAHTSNLIFSPDGQTLLSDGPENLILWGTESGSQLRMLEGYDDVVTSLAFSPDGRLVVAAGWKGVVLWEQESGIILNTFSENTYNVTDTVWIVAFSPDGRLLATIDKNAYLKLWGIP